MPGEATSVTLSRPSLAARAEDDAEHDAGVCSSGVGRRAGLDHLLGALQKLVGIEAHDGGGNHAEVGERGVAAADGGDAVEDVAEAVALGDLLHLGAGIGDGDEMAAGLVAHGLLHALEEILFVDIRFECAAGLAGDDEERFGEIDFLLDGS